MASFLTSTLLNLKAQKFMNHLQTDSQRHLNVMSRTLLTDSLQDKNFLNCYSASPVPFDVKQQQQKKAKKNMK